MNIYRIHFTGILANACQILPLDSCIPLDMIASINAQHPDDPVTRQVDVCNALIMATIGYMTI